MDGWPSIPITVISNWPSNSSLSSAAWKVGGSGVENNFGFVPWLCCFTFREGCPILPEQESNLEVTPPAKRLALHFNTFEGKEKKETYQTQELSFLQSTMPLALPQDFPHGHFQSPRQEPSVFK
jgi:hypothetical protein